MYRKLLEFHEELALEPTLRYTAANLDPRQRMVYHALKYAQINQVEGDYLEFGVWKGNTFLHAYQLAQKFGTPRHFYAFDSFEGDPDTEETTRNGVRLFNKGQYKCTLSDFKSRLFVLFP